MPVSFGDVSPNDLDPYELDEYGDFLIPDLISFRYFQVNTPGTTAYQLSYFTLANPEAVVHMRLGLFTTNTSVINSFASTPIFTLLANASFSFFCLSLYQGLLLLSPFSSTNSYGTYSPVRYGVGHLSLFARIAKYPTQYHLGVVELQMTNTSSGRDIVYTSSVNSQPLDGSGLTFSTDFGDGPVRMTLFYNTTTGRYQDSTQALLGRERLTTMVVRPVDPAVGVPQCGVLDLPVVVFPNSSLVNHTSCSAGSSAVMWADDMSGDYFYSSEGLLSNYLSTGPHTLSPSFLSRCSQFAFLLPTQVCFSHF